MPALKRTDFGGAVAWLGVVADRAGALAATGVPELHLRLDGAEGESHGGLTRAACSRVAALHPRGTLIRNSRQLSIVSLEELAQIAAAMGLPALAPAMFGANIQVSGLPDLSLLPPGSRLQARDGATLVVDMENRPCALVAREIEAAHPGYGARFKPAAARLRGVTAWVERQGTLRLGDTLSLFIPDQPSWPHLAKARGH